jgi:hypothetical protein
MNSAIIDFIMEQACPGCGFVSDRPMRYCRQCGKQLFVENELTSAETRNYDPNRAQAANTPYPSHPSHPSHHGSWGNEMKEVQETTRFYRPPLASNYDVPEKKKSRIGLWIMMAVPLLFLFGLVVLVVRYLSPPQPVIPAVKVATAEIERELERMSRELERAKRFPPPPSPPSPPGASQTDIAAVFDKYKYPNAQIDQKVSAIGSEFIKMSTNDTVDVVKDFYQRVIGVSPSVQSKDKEKEQIIFQASNSPPFLVIIGPDDELPSKTQIVLIRSGFQIPK